MDRTKIFKQIFTISFSIFRRRISHCSDKIDNLFNLISFWNWFSILAKCHIQYYNTVYIEIVDVTRNGRIFFANFMDIQFRILLKKKSVIFCCKAGYWLPREMINAVKSIQKFDYFSRPWKKFACKMYKKKFHVRLITYYDSFW